MGKQYYGRKLYTTQNSKQKWNKKIFPQGRFPVENITKIRYVAPSFTIRFKFYISGRTSYGLCGIAHEIVEFIKLLEIYVVCTLEYRKFYMKFLTNAVALSSVRGYSFCVVYSFLKRYCFLLLKEPKEQQNHMSFCNMLLKHLFLQNIFTKLYPIHLILNFT